MISASQLNSFGKGLPLLASNANRSGKDRLLIRMGFFAWALIMDTMTALFSLLFSPIPVIGWITPYIFSVCMNATSGAALTLALTREFGFFPKRLIGGFITETVPVANNLPFWSGLTLSLIIQSAMNDNAPEAAASLAPQAESRTSRQAGRRPPEREATEEAAGGVAPAQRSRPMEDIRAA